MSWIVGYVAYFELEKKRMKDEKELLERGKKIAEEIGLNAIGIVDGGDGYAGYRMSEIHKLLGEGAEVLGHKKTDGGWGFDQSGIIPGVTTHTALLIAIRPIEPPKCETRVQELERAVEELLKATDHWVGRDAARERAMALLGRTK